MDRRPRIEEVPLPTWKNLIDQSLTTDERIYLVTAILSDGHETEAVKNLHGSYAQIIVDALDQVRSRSRSQKRRL